MAGKSVNFYADGIKILKEGMSGFEKDDKFIFYWTEDDDTGKGTKVYVDSEKKRDEILQHYFEASMGAIEGIKYNKKAVRFSGVTFFGSLLS